MSQNKVEIVKCAQTGCNAKVLSTPVDPRRFCSRHKRPSRPCEVVGQLSTRDFTRAMIDTRAESARQNDLAVEKQNREAAEKAAAFMAVKPFAPVAAAIQTELRQEFSKAEPIVATGRAHGKFVSRATYAEARVTAMKLAMLGFGE